ncbi:MAG: DUF3829 domain-containing protein [Hyphomicrobiales bacterium]|nr:MAG: DUF3829 domain-containing protein [Hyphomicrobiales bacterium]
MRIGFYSLLLAACLYLSLGSTTSHAQPSALTQKMNAAVGCINRLSGRAHESKSRYFSWVTGNGPPTGKERVIYGTYTVYDTAECKRTVEQANALEPHEPDLEAAAATFVTAITALEPLLKETDEYYTQENYKDDKMAKGRALHPRLVAAWKAFEAADHRLRVDLDVLQDRQAVERLAEIEKSEGRSARYHVEALMMRAKRVQNAGNTSAPEVPKLIDLIAEYETIVKASEEFAGKGGQIGSSFVSASKAYLVTAKQLMRRLRDKVPYSQGEKMMMGSGGAWMIEGSPARLTRDYNQLVESYNRGAKF